MNGHQPNIGDGPPADAPDGLASSAHKPGSAQPGPWPKLWIARVEICCPGGPTRVFLSDGSELAGGRDVAASAGVDENSLVSLSAHVMHEPPKQA